MRVLELVENYMSPESHDGAREEKAPEDRSSIEALQETRNRMDKDFLAMLKIESCIASKDFEGAQKIIDEWKARVEKELHG